MSATDLLVLVLGLLLGTAVGAIAYAMLRPSPRDREVRLTITRGALPPITSSGPAAGATPVTFEARADGTTSAASDATPVGAPALDPPFVSAEAAPGALPWSGRADVIPVAQGNDPTFARLVRAPDPSQAVSTSAEGEMKLTDAAGSLYEPAVAFASVSDRHAPQMGGSRTDGDVPNRAVAAAPGTAPSVSPAFAWVAPAGAPRASGPGSLPPAAYASGAVPTALPQEGPRAKHPDTGEPGASASHANDAPSPAGDAPLPPGDAVPASARPPSTASGGDDPCAAERRLVDERCALAARLHDSRRAAAAQQREVRQAYEAATGMSEAARRSIDGRTVLDSKTEAQRQFRRSRLAATSAAELETAARVWLEEIDRINRAVRQGRATLASEQERATRLLATMEEISVRVDAARISAEGADERCREAREGLARCEELHTSLHIGHIGHADTPRTVPPPFVPSPAPEPTGQEPLASARAPADAGASLPMPTVLRIARGDQAALTGIVERLAGGSPEEERRWQLWLGEFLDAVRAAAVDAGALEFPLDHPFWGIFTQAQCRDIAMALASLGFRYDGERGFADDRLPSQRDLSLAVGYAGLDPLRIRRWPGEAGMSELYRGVGVAADQYLAAATPDLTLSELIQALGRRAEPLTDLWNAWGRVRPLLLAST